MNIPIQDVLALFEADEPIELRYKDIIRSLDVPPERRIEFKRFLADMVRNDILRLRKGSWYRLGEGSPDRMKKGFSEFGPSQRARCLPSGWGPKGRGRALVLHR